MTTMPTFGSTLGYLSAIAAIHGAREQAIRDEVYALRVQAAQTRAAAAVVQARVAKKTQLLALLRAQAAH